MPHAQSDDRATGAPLEQITLAGLCAALGLIAVVMFATGFLHRLFIEAFFWPVFLGGVLLLLLAVVRLVALRRNFRARHLVRTLFDDECCPAGETQSPLRFIIIALPVVLFTLGLPKNGFVGEGRIGVDSRLESLDRDRQALATLAGSPALTPVFRKPNPTTRYLNFLELDEAASSATKRERYTGDIGVLRGQYMPLRIDNSTSFTLFRMNMVCCAADAIPLSVRIVAPAEYRQTVRQGDWLQVRGTISFEYIPAWGKYHPILIVHDAKDITPTAPVYNTKH